MSYVGPLYIFSKYGKFMYLLSTIDGEGIEQMFHVSRLKSGLLRLRNGKSVKNINDYRLQMIQLKSDTTDKKRPGHCCHFKNMCENSVIPLCQIQQSYFIGF